jgi:signal transduction histidine kinase
LARHALDQLTSVGPAVEQARLVASLDAMERSGNDILQLTDELLELARGEVGYLRLVTAPTDLLQLVQGLAHSTRWLALHQNNQLQLVTDLAWPHVALDATRLVQVLRNLLANACAATHNGIITLGLRSTPAVEAGHAQLDVWVSDTGRGMAPEVLGRIFEPFEQVDMASATGSSGLGLAIARQWVRLMGSEIGVQSSQGQGSTFFWSMQVPVAETVAAAVNANPLPAAAAARQPHHPDSLDWAQLRTLADSGDGLGVDAWITRHRHQLSDDPLAQGVLALGESLQLAALVRWLDSHHKPL